MGLLDSVIGAALGGGQQQNNPLGGLLGSLLGGGQQQQAGGMAAMLPALIPVVAGMLGNDGGHGGLGGLIGKFQQAGMGDHAASWVGSGENMPISADQLSQVFGQGGMSDIAAKLGVSQGEAGGLLAQALPQIINHMTPGGQAPAGGLGSMGDIAGMLGGLLQQKA